MRVLFVFGPNLGALGRREPERYGTQTLEEIAVEVEAEEHGALVQLAAAALHRDGQHDDGDTPHERRDGDRQETVRGVKCEDGNEPGAPGIKGREHGEMLVAIARCCKSL